MTSMTRRQAIFAPAILALIPGLAARQGLASALGRYRRAAATHARISAERDRLAESPGATRTTIRAAESRMNSAWAAADDASEEIIEALDRLDLAAVVEGGHLFAVADLESDGLRRLVVLPLDRIGSGD